jgi:hypothetical protein
MKTATRRTCIRVRNDGACIMRETEAGSNGSHCDECGKQRIVNGRPQQLFVYFTEGDTIMQHDGSFCSDVCHDEHEPDSVNHCQPQQLPVLFRIDGTKRNGGPFLTAVFPTLPGNVGDRYSMTCYAHVGQHSACSFAWYNGTRAAKPVEYADLLAELIGQGYDNLKIYQRITPQLRAELAAAVRWPNPSRQKVYQQRAELATSVREQK